MIVECVYYEHRGMGGTPTSALWGRRFHVVQVVVRQLNGGWAVALVVALGSHLLCFSIQEMRKAGWVEGRQYRIEEVE